MCPVNDGAYCCVEICPHEIFSVDQSREKGVNKNLNELHHAGKRKSFDPLHEKPFLVLKWD